MGNCFTSQHKKCYNYSTCRKRVSVSDERYYCQTCSNTMKNIASTHDQSNYTASPDPPPDSYQFNPSHSNVSLPSENSAFTAHMRSKPRKPVKPFTGLLKNQVDSGQGLAGYGQASYGRNYGGCDSD